ncbi:MAG: VOC family protein [Ilumatobacteraceae bacterium]|nr:VOC family protein [Ilumatobacteraceae bacterium]
MSLFRVMYSPDDFDAAAHFFQEVLGLGVVGSWDDDGRGAIFQAPAAQIEIFGGPASPERPHRPDPAAGPVPIGLAWEVVDVDGWTETVVARGAELVAPPVDRPWGMRAATVCGPDGLLVTGFELI